MPLPLEPVNQLKCEINPVVEAAVDGRSSGLAAPILIEPQRADTEIPQTPVHVPKMVPVHVRVKAMAHDDDMLGT
jgi:hypothetical protein